MLHNVFLCVAYLLFAELSDRQDVLAHQWVQQRRGLQVGQRSSNKLSCSRLRGQDPGQRRRVAVTIASAGRQKHNHLCREWGDTAHQLNTRAKHNAVYIKRQIFLTFPLCWTVRPALWDVWYLVEVQDRRSGGCEEAAGSGSHLLTGGGWAPWFGLDLPGEG